MVGNRVRVRVKKNKVAPPFREAEFDIMYNEGISMDGDILDLGTTLDIVDKRGSFYTFNDTRLGQGRENAKTFLRENPGICDEIEGRIRSSAEVGEALRPAARFSTPAVGSARDGDHEDLDDDDGGDMDEA